MNKTVKPKKPTKNDKAPKEQLLIQHWGCIDNKGELFLSPVIYRDYCIEDFYGDDLYSNDTIAFYQLLKLKDLTPKGNYDLTGSCLYDGYFEGWIISWGEENSDYKKELEDFNKRFDRYAYKLKKYEEQMTLYNIWKKEQEILELKKKIEVKEKELKK